MWFIEPVKFEIEAKGEKTPIVPGGTFLPMWDPPYTWLFDKIVREDDKFEVVNHDLIQNIIERELKERLEKAEKITPKITEYILKSIRQPRYHRPYPELPPLFVYENTMVLPSLVSGTFYVISTKKESIPPLLDAFNRKINQIKDIVKDLGLYIKGIYYGPSFTEYIINKISRTLSKGEFKRQLEKEVYESISRNITTSILHNLTLGFGGTEKKPFENFEYDMISCFTERLKLQIEVKDYSRQLRFQYK